MSLNPILVDAKSLTFSLVIETKKASQLPPIGISDTLFQLQNLEMVESVLLYPNQGKEKNLDLFIELFPNLSWPTWCKIWKQDEAERLFSFEHFCRKNHFPNIGTVKKQMDFLIRLPIEIQNEFSIKNMNFFDLNPIFETLCAWNLEIKEFLLQQILEKKPTKTQWLSSLEIILEIIAQQKKSQEELNTIISKSKLWIDDLQKIRFPRSHQQKLDLNKILSQNSLTINSQVQRNGDSLGIQISGFLKNPQEIIKLEASLNKLKSAWENQLQG